MLMIKKLEEKAELVKNCKSLVDPRKLPGVPTDIDNLNRG